MSPEELSPIRHRKNQQKKIGREITSTTTTTTTTTTEFDVVVASASSSTRTSLTPPTIKTMNGNSHVNTGGGGGNDKVSIIPKFAYTEINLGRVLGEGGFCRVREISSVDVDEVYDTSDDEAKSRRNFANDVGRCNAGSISGATGSTGGYVLKTLRQDLPEDEHTKGILDLAIESEFLSVINHPNIICMRAISNSDPHESRFFVVLEKLVQILEKRFNYWRKVVSDNAGYWWPCFGIGYCCGKTPPLVECWKQRILASLDISKAMQHLHNSGIVYRDLKPDNIGFDSNGQLKLFDFGLSKRVKEVEKSDDGSNNYLLTGNTGSLRYMAPEVALDMPYNLSCDTYSFGILFWQICSLTTPFAGYSQKMHAEKVVKQNQRPKPDSTWPLSWVELMTQCWDREPTARPNFDTITNILQDRYEELENEEDGDDVLPTRANEIKAKKRKKKVAPENHQSLDVDTRISSSSTTTTTEGDGVSKRFDAEVV